ncbi:cell division protein ZapA [Neptunomonas qingdaonensis]|uniref:Cell division protein ZapA n=1 Tax=Neptunomonas qingdaonensis TaxID=1045558 RepID=A0A1I2VP82_9GAMM|nr:cell division protein ZapA [Neptunomonas qingdaonensis]SFG90972.1 cell division protein ZapA [Neptunomonas qingdaonensis]
MSNDPGHKVAIRIMDKEYLVGCPEGAENELFTSAEYLDKKMREIRDAGKVLGLERVAVMTALNLSHELLKSKAEHQGKFDERIQKLNKKIDSSLAITEKTGLNE